MSYKNALEVRLYNTFKGVKKVLFLAFFFDDFKVAIFNIFFGFLCYTINITFKKIGAIKMARGRAINIYLNDENLSDLEFLAKFFGDSRSGIIQGLIKSGANSLRQIALDNPSNTTLFPEISELNDDNFISVLNKMNNSFKDLKLEIDSIKKGFKSAKVKRA